MVNVTELNRGPDISANAIDAASVSASESITDPAGNTFTDLSDPVRVTEDAVTFAESDVTVTNNNTEVSNESIQLSGSQTLGDVLIEWDSGVPADIDSWDLATYQATEDGETVTVDVVEGVFSDLIIDDFEDNDITVLANDWSGWSGDTGSFSAQQATTISGSYSGELSSSGEYVAVNTTRSSDTTSILEIATDVGSDTGDSGDSVQIVIQTVSGDFLLSLSFVDNGALEESFSGQTILSSWDVGSDYVFRVEPDFDNDEAEIIVNGTNQGTFPFNSTASGWGSIELRNDTGSSGASRSAFIDDVAEITKTYSDLFTDIGPNFDISTIATSTNVTLRANLSRSNTANNPTLDYAGRRFTR